MSDFCNNNDVKISIIIPVYNTEPYLDKCLGSIVSQTLKEFEVIATDSGSSDNSVQKLKAWAEKDSRIKVITPEKKMNAGMARNEGLNAARGKYIMFLDSDDFYYNENSLAKAYETIENSDKDAVVFGNYELYPRDKFKNGVKTNLLYNIVNNLAEPEYMKFVNIWAYIYKRSFIEEHKLRFFPECATGEDILFTYLLIFNNAKIGFITDRLMVYRQFRKGSLVSAYLNGVKNDIVTVKKFFAEPLCLSRPDRDKLAAVRQFLGNCEFYYKKCQTRSERKQLLQDIIEMIKTVEGFCGKSLLKTLPIYRDLKSLIKAETSFVYVGKPRILGNARIKLFSIKLILKKSNRKLNFEKFSRKYSKTIDLLKNEVKTRKIRVAFYVINDMWKCQNLYDEFLKNPHFEPFVLVGKNGYGPFQHAYQQESDILKIIETFRKKNIEVYSVYDFEKEEPIPFKNFNPDIIFYTSPWQLLACHQVHKAADNYLTCYIPYFISNSPAKLEAGSEFHSSLWRYYVLNEQLRNEYAKVMLNKGKNLKVSGYPMLEDYSREFTKSKDYVIYAPHWSVGETVLNYATFETNGKFMLEFAKAHPEINWVFKPHPLLKERLIVTEVMTRDEVENYYKEWDEIGLKYEGTDYTPLFRDSVALITDCGSFLAEYLPSKNPVILLKSANATPYNFLGEKVTEHYYKAYNTGDLQQLLETVVLQKRDENREKRLQTLEELALITDASKNIVEDLSSTLDIANREEK